MASFSSLSGRWIVGVLTQALIYPDPPGRSYPPHPRPRTHPSHATGSKSFFGYYDEGYCGGTRVRIGWRAYKPLHDGPNGFDENFQLTNWTLRFAHYIKSITDTFSNRQRRSSPSDRFNTLARALMLPEGEEVEVEMD